MVDHQSQLSSTVNPSESASRSGGRKKPGKAERAAKRSAVGAPTGQPASAMKAAAFAGSVSTDPQPRPGHYPVVFQTGAGEPSRDKTFSIDGKTIDRVLRPFASRYVSQPQYAEFKANSGVDDMAFMRQTVSAALLRLAQQIVHSHVNMGLPQGDFAPVASSDVRVFSSVSAYLNQFGEFSVPALGTRFLLSGYEETVTRLVMAADDIVNRGMNGVLKRMWLPVCPTDRHTKTVVASALNEFIRSVDVQIPATVLEDAVLSGSVPDAWEGIKDYLGPEPEEGAVDRRDRFDFVFRASADAPDFVTHWSTESASAALLELGLEWSSPSAGHVNWQYNVKSSFTRLADSWAKRAAAYAKFFELSSGLASRSSASGSPAQMAEVKTVTGVTVLSTSLALSAPEFSLSVCFPASCVFTGGLDRLVILTTPLSVDQRATEFCQMDWR